MLVVVGRAANGLKMIVNRALYACSLLE